MLRPIRPLSARLDPEAAVRDDPFVGAAHEVMRESIVCELVLKGIARPRRWKAERLDVEDGGYVLDAHGLDAQIPRWRFHCTGGFRGTQRDAPLPTPVSQLPIHDGIWTLSVFDREAAPVAVRAGVERRAAEFCDRDRPHAGVAVNGGKRAIGFHFACLPSK